MKLSLTPHEATAALTLLLVSAGTLSCLYPLSEAPFFRWSEAHAVEWMLFLLAGGLLFFILNRSWLMYICFGGCAIICYTLQERTTNALTHPPATADTFNIRLGVFHIPGEGPLLDHTLRAIVETGTDIAAIRDIPPATLSYVEDFLFRHGYRNSRSDLQRDAPKAIAVYARPSMEFLPSSEPCELSLISGRINLAIQGVDRDLQVIHACLPAGADGSRISSGHLDQVSRQISPGDGPVIALGNFGRVPWSYNLQEFKKTAALNDSREGPQSFSSQGHLTLFDPPAGCIFYSNHLQCIRFETISGRDATPLGVVGTYQFATKARSANVTQTSQEL